MHESKPWGIDPSLMPFATGVGVLCQVWAGAEYSIADTLRMFLNLPSTTANEHVLHCFDSREQIKAIKLYAVENIQIVPLVDALFSCLDYIDNELRAMRNDWIHADWCAEDPKGKGPVSTMSYKARISRPQARQPRQWSSEWKDRKIEELAADINEVREHTNYLSQIACFHDYDHQSPELKRRLAKSPARRHLLHPRGKQHP
jgi:hypothetical protein